MTSKTKLLLQVENGEKLCLRILEIVVDSSSGKVLLWRTAPWQQSIHHGVKLFLGWPGNSPDLKLMICCEFKVGSCRIKNAPCRRPCWKESLFRCGRTSYHYTFDCFTKAYQGAWKLKLMLKKFTQIYTNLHKFTQIIYALIGEKLNCIVSCRYTFWQDSKCINH